MSWGKGWQVGVNKTIYEHARTQEIAAKILSGECGVKHKPGTHDLCPRCNIYKRQCELDRRAP